MRNFLLDHNTLKWCFKKQILKPFIQTGPNHNKIERGQQRRAEGENEESDGDIVGGSEGAESRKRHRNRPPKLPSNPTPIPKRLRFSKQALPNLLRHSPLVRPLLLVSGHLPHPITLRFSERLRSPNPTRQRRRTGPIPQQQQPIQRSLLRFATRTTPPFPRSFTSHNNNSKFRFQFQYPKNCCLFAATERLLPLRILGAFFGLR